VVIGERGPAQVPVDLAVWTWPLEVVRVACGECGTALPVRRHTEPGEVADAAAAHAGDCPVRSQPADGDPIDSVPPGAYGP
jgi:hypothetical protein